MAFLGPSNGRLAQARPWQPAEAFMELCKARNEPGYARHGVGAAGRRIDADPRHGAERRQAGTSVPLSSCVPRYRRRSD